MSKMNSNDEARYLVDRLREAMRSNDTDTALGQAVARLKQPFVLGDGKKWYYEAFVSMASAVRQALAAIDDTISPDLPPFLLDPATYAWLFRIPLEDFNWRGGDDRFDRSALPRRSPSEPSPAVHRAEQEPSSSQSGAGEYLTLTEAARLIPGRRPGKRVSLGTLWRWCTKGLRQGIRLKSVLAGGQRCTTRQWVQDFIEAMTQVSQPAPADAPVVVRTPTQRQTASERAAAELKAAWERRRPG
jgi:hypothetical protein